MKRSNPSRVFFPWERRRGVFGTLGRARGRLVLAAVVGVLAVSFLRSRENKSAAIRATRASISTLFRAVASYRAEHAGACPKELGALIAEGHVRDLPLDAWGRPLRLTCPGRRDPLGYDIASDGPDGLPGGLDRVE